MLIEVDKLPLAWQDEAKRLNILRVIVTPERTYGVRLSPMWGARLVEIKNPQGTEIDPSNIGALDLIKPFPRIPATIWQRWVKLCFYFCDEKRPNDGIDKVSEVSCRFSRSMEDSSKWRCWIPKQEVGGGHVHANFGEMIDIETGETIKTWPPDNEFDAGSSHSHNHMSAFFSGIDDSSELGSPGFHAVVGKIDRATKKYELTASIVLDKKRYTIEPADTIIDLGIVKDVVFHPNVLNNIKKQEYKGGGGGGYTARYPVGAAGPSEAWRSKWSKHAEPRKGTIHLSTNPKIKEAQLKALENRLQAILEHLVTEPAGITAIKNVAEGIGLQVTPFLKATSDTKP